MQIVNDVFSIALISRLGSPDGGLMLIACACFIVVALMVAYAGKLNSQRFLHVLQLDSYQLDGYRRSLRRNRVKDTQPLFLIAIFTCILEAAFFYPMTLLGKGLSPTALIALHAVPPAVFLAVSYLYAKKRAREKQKKEFVDTPRMKRLKRAYFALNFTFCIIALFLSMIMGLRLRLLALDEQFGSAYLGMVLTLGCSAVALIPFVMTQNIVALAAFLRKGPENRINRGYIEDARRIIKARPELIRIGITGSYGKTSAKFILGGILGEKYDVLVPPSSYNTPMGLTRAIREMLTPSNQVFIAEMGARRVGEIKELCDIAYPQYGILTSIGRQHLETFGSLENVAKTKYELMQSLPENGIGFFPADSGECERLYHEYKGNKRLFGIDGDYFMTARDIKAGARGSTFTLLCAGQSAECTTSLLGMHNIMNILGCAACAYELGMNLQEIAAGIGKVRGVEHRLQIIDPGTGVIVIDDAFNSNPAGTAAAMDVLGMFEGMRRICVTPGLIELGEEEEDENRKFGGRMAQVCDIVIAVGKNQTAIEKGLLESGFDMQNLFKVHTLDEATKVLAKLTRRGDVVLFENDLPDNY